MYEIRIGAARQEMVYYLSILLCWGFIILHPFMLFEILLSTKKGGLWYKYAILLHCGTMQIGSLPLHLYIPETWW